VAARIGLCSRARECAHGFIVDDEAFIGFKGMHIIIARDEFRIPLSEKADPQEAPEGRG
jgi:hypothetical protein